MPRFNGTPRQPKWGALMLAIFCAAASSIYGAAPAVPQARLIPIGDGVSSSSINTVIFRHSPLVTFEKTQYAAYYDAQGHVVLARRSIDSDRWEVKRTELTGNVRDAHNTISLGMDGNGILHLSWDHHGANLNYVQTTAPGSLELTARLQTDGQRENAVTYPEFYSLPDGKGGSDLLLMYRVGSSGNGDLVLKRYRSATKKWETVAQNLVAGEGRQNAYPEFAVGPDGTLHLGWVWRRSPDVSTNHDICYAQSRDGGATWSDSTGKKLALPITAATCEVALKIPERSELINQTTIAGDKEGHPYIATYFRPEGTAVPQFHVVHHDGTKWQASQVGARKQAFTLAGGGTKRIPISRPLIMVDAKNSPPAVFVAFRDVERGDKASLASTDNLKEGKWEIRDISQESWGSWEPSFDPTLWNRERIINLFVQKTDQLDGNDASARTLPPTKASVLEYKP